MSLDAPVTVEEVEFSECLESIRSVRFTVFVDEQKVPEALEMDEWDARSRHVLATLEGRAVGTGRLLPDGHIGRVAVLRECRGLRIGQLLMEKLMKMGKESGFEKLELSAQLHAAPFYERLGFQRKGEVYLEAGIDHVFMQYSPNGQFGD